MHVTSNPFFAFHDDVFPAFSKNAVSQPRFPRSNLYHKTIVPDKYFSSLEELTHISTVEIELNGTDIFELEIDVGKKSRAFKEAKILECNFFDGTTFFRVGILKNGSFWMDSHFFDRHYFQQSNSSQHFAFHFHSERSFVEVFEEKFDFCLLYTSPSPRDS